VAGTRGHWATGSLGHWVTLLTRYHLLAVEISRDVAVNRGSGREGRDQLGVRDVAALAVEKQRVCALVGLARGCCAHAALGLFGALGQSDLLLQLEVVLELGYAVHDGGPMVAAQVLRLRVACAHDAAIGRAAGERVTQRRRGPRADAAGGKARRGVAVGRHGHDEVLQLLEALVHLRSGGSGGHGMVGVRARLAARGARGARLLAVAAEPARRAAISTAASGDRGGVR
jgi:hypothetical protein